MLELPSQDSDAGHSSSFITSQKDRGVVAAYADHPFVHHSSGRSLCGLKNVASKTLRSQAIATPHWQKGFFDHVLRTAESYEQKWHYVRENPVRAGLAKRWEDWPYRGEIFALEYRAKI